MSVMGTRQSPPTPRQYGWLPFWILVVTVVALGIGILLLDHVGGTVAAVLWFPLLVLLVWSAIRLRVEYRQALQESAWARAAEAALLQSQERNRAIVETALDGVITTDASGIVTDWNSQATVLFGWAREEAMGKPLAEMIIPDLNQEAHLRGIQEYLRTGAGSILNRRMEVTARHKDGREFPVELSVSPARIGEVYMFSTFVRDITDRRSAERL